MGALAASPSKEAAERCPVPVIIRDRAFPEDHVP